MRRPRAGDERSSQALGRCRGSARRPIRAACQELADGMRRMPLAGTTDRSMATHKGPASGRNGRQDAALKRKARPGAGRPFTTVGEAERRRPQMSPGREKNCSGGAPGGASASSQGGADTEPTTAAPSGAPTPRIRRGGRRRRTRRRKETGRRSRAKSTHRSCLKVNQGTAVNQCLPLCGGDVTHASIK